MSTERINLEGQWISKFPKEYNYDASDYYDDNPNTLIRKEFNIKKTNSNYYLNVGCLGYYIAYINGKRVGDYELNSDWTQYDKTIYYDTYEVSKLLANGKNVISFELGNGMYNPAPLRLFGKYNLRERLRLIGEPCLIASIHENEICILKTDKSWKVSDGPLLFNNLYIGERFDARQAQDHWKLIGFDDLNWKEAIIDNNKKGKLVKSKIPKVKRKKILEPISININSKGNLIIDFGETLSAVINISFLGVKDKKVKLVYAENINEDNTVNCDSSLAGNVGVVLEGVNIRFDGGPGAPEHAMQVDEIISKDGENHYTNKFTYHSFRYVEVSGLKKDDLKSITATYVYTDVDVVGKLETDNSWINKLYDLALKTKLNNIHSVFEDCARERLGYGGDIVALATSNLFMFDLDKMYEKTVIDFRQDQTKKGGVPETAPYMGIQTNGTGEGEGPILWQLAYPYLVYKHYQYYGDKELILDEYEYLRKQMLYLKSIGIEELQDKCLGDHGSSDTKVSFKVGTPDKKFLACCAYYLFLQYNRYFAMLAEDMIYKEYEEELVKVKAFIDNNFKNDDGTYGNKSQSSFAFAIFTHISDEPEKLCKMYVDKIKEDNGYLRSGIFGMMMTFEVLNKYGYDEVIEEWLFKDEYPSIGNMIKEGKIALSEQFDMKNCSHNHAMFSSYTQWFYQGLAGIRVNDEAIKANKITLKPYFSKKVNQVECTFKTLSGEISSNWKIENGQVIWKFNIPGDIEKFDVILSSDYSVIETNYNEKRRENGQYYMIIKL